MEGVAISGSLLLRINGPFEKSRFGVMGQDVGLVGSYKDAPTCSNIHGFLVGRWVDGGYIFVEIVSF